MMRKMRNTFKRESGFTLIELLVVIAVLGILAAIAIPRLTGVTDKARLSEAQSALGTIKDAEEMHYIEKSSYAASTSALSEYLDSNSLPQGWTYSFATGASVSGPNLSSTTSAYSIIMEGNSTDVPSRLSAILFKENANGQAIIKTEQDDNDNFTDQ